MEQLEDTFDCNCPLPNFKMNKKYSLYSKLSTFALIVILIFEVCLLQITIHPTSILAQSDQELEQQLREKRGEIDKIEKQLEETKTQAKTLKTQLQFIDGQISLTKLKIDETSFQITKLLKEITNLESSIIRVSKSVDQISEVLLNRIIKTYKYSYVSNLDLLFSSDGFADLLERIKYIQIAQAYDKKKLYELQATKQLFHDQKQDKQVRQNKLSQEKQKLESYRIQLDNQKKAKEELLQVTKNDEVAFQALLERLRADSESISRALSGKGIKIGDVRKGDRIAGVGNSGCSTGPHLHLEVMTPAHVEEVDGKYIITGSDNKVDPLPYLQSGQFPKPTESYSGNDCSQGGSCFNGYITTRFKQWYNVLGGSYHTGLDIADYSGASVYGASDGTSYLFTDSKACSLTGTIGKGIVIDHKDSDIVTLYWHIP